MDEWINEESGPLMPLFSEVHYITESSGILLLWSQINLDILVYIFPWIPAIHLSPKLLIIGLFRKLRTVSPDLVL